MSEKTKRYIDPLTDFGFKHYFGTELNKKILLKFLNAVFEEKKQIEDVSFIPAAKNREGNSAAGVYSDLLCKEKNGNQFSLLLRKVEREFFLKNSREFIERFFKELEASTSSDDQPDKEHYMLGLLDFSFGDCEETYYREISLTKVDLKRNPIGKLSLKFMEIPEFHKRGKDLATDMDKWFYLLKHLRRLNRVPAWLEDERFKDVFLAGEVSALTADQQELYADDLKNKKKKFFEIYNPDQAALEAMKKEMDNGRLDTESREYFLEVFRMGYETGFEEGMLEIANEIGSVFK